MSVLTPRAAGQPLPRPSLLRSGAAILVLLPTAGVAWGQAAGAPDVVRPTVVVETAQYDDIREQSTFNGRIEAISKIELRARVEGLLTRQEFKEGSAVKKGQLLFEIERKPYEIAVAGAQASLAGVKADLADASEAFARTTDLLQRQVSTEASLSSAKARLAQAQAKVSVQEADLERAKLNLGYTQIVAEIDGRVGRALHAVGDLVNSGSGPLATLVSQDPVYVTFAVPQPQLAGMLKADGGVSKAAVKLTLADGSVYEHTGEISFADVEATATTNTILVRATVPNPEGHLVDQELLQVAVVDASATKTLTISQSALLLDQLGGYVLALDSNNKVEIKRIVPGEQQGSMLTVISGLAAGDRIIVSGHLKAQPGMVVNPEVAQDGDAAPRQAAEQ